MKISDHCFALQGLYFSPPWSVNAGFIVGEKQTLIIDTGSCTATAQTIYGYGTSVKPDNELLVINTEKHLDHMGGNSFFLDKGISVLGHHLVNRNSEEIKDLKRFL